MGVKRTRCTWRDPVECTQAFASSSLYKLHEQVLEHLNTVHDHAGDGGFYVQWKDGAGTLHQIGECAGIRGEG